MDNDRAVRRITPMVTRAIGATEAEERRAALHLIAEELFASAWDELDPSSGPEDIQGEVDRFAASIIGAVDATTDESDPELVAQWIVTAAINAATVAAAEPGARFIWRTMQDDRVREMHVPLHGTTTAAGVPFDVGGYPLMYPGQPVGPPDVWINCRCRLDVAASDQLAAAAGPSDGIAVVARVADADRLAVAGGLPPEGLHATLGFFGHTGEQSQQLRETLAHWVSNQSLMAEASVGGVARMGDDDPQATVLLLESPELEALRRSLEGVATPDGKHPHFTPHMTLGYGIDPPDSAPRSVMLDGVELWWGDDHVTAAISEEPWSKWSAADYSIEQWHRACLIHLHSGAPTSKGECKLPVRTPTGTVNRAGVHAAAAALAGARGGVNAPAEQKAKARRALRGLYSQLKEEPPDSLAASLDDEALVAVGPVNTHDAPGWITNPRETQRLRTYWTRGKGVAKIGWGAPGDFNRCRRQLGKYIHNKAYLDGTCANLHYVALGFWPNQGPHKGKHGHRGHRLSAAALEPIDVQLDSPELLAVLAAFSAADELEDTMLPPIEWFQDPGFDGPMPLTISADGQVSGHLATWDTCHVGIDKQCVTAPRSTHDYAYFRTGEVETAGGPVSVGNITMNTGHAGDDLSPNETVRHYDHTGTVVADVAAGEDQFGIWVAGATRPGVTEAQVHAVKAGALSGDWRRIAGNLELVGALVVNVPGFPIPRVSMAASGDMVLSLTAAAIVTVDPNVSYGRIELVVEKGVTAALDKRDRHARAARITDALRAERARRLLETVG
jgi:2'-5' RNA ligase